MGREVCLENERRPSLNPTHREWKSEAKSTHIHMHLVGAGTGASRYGSRHGFTVHARQLQLRVRRQLKSLFDASESFFLSRAVNVDAWGDVDLL